MKKQNLRILLSGFCLSSLIALVAFLFLMAAIYCGKAGGILCPFPTFIKVSCSWWVASWSLPSNESGGVCLEPAMS